MGDRGDEQDRMNRMEGRGAGGRVLEQDLVDRRHGSIPVGSVLDEVTPEIGGRELGGHDHGASGQQGRQETAQQAVYVEQGMTSIVLSLAVS